jgi:hypothetical protein
MVGVAVGDVVGDDVECVGVGVGVIMEVGDGDGVGVADEFDGCDPCRAM